MRLKTVTKYEMQLCRLKEDGKSVLNNDDSAADAAVTYMLMTLMPMLL